jgi:acyl carrier protein
VGTVARILSDALPPHETMAEHTEIVSRIRRVLIQSLSLGMREEDLKYTNQLDEMVALDSMAILEFIAGLEREFGIAIEPEQMEFAMLKDLPKLAGYIARRTSDHVH